MTILLPGTRTQPRPVSDDEGARRRRVRGVLGALAVLCVLLGVAFLLYDVQGSRSYALDLRSRQLAALVVVGVAVGASSVVFQTVAGSRILTPGVMGFDALYVLLQTIVVYAFGSSTLLLLGVRERFVLDLVVLTAFGLLLFRWLFRRYSRDLLVLVLVGLVLSSLFASVTSFASRLLSPDDFLTLQDIMFASFSTVDTELLAVTAVVAVLGCAALVPLLHSLDVIALGHDHAVALGVRYHGVVTLALVVVTVLVAASTALVGPMLFLGLIVANLARQLLATHRHTELVLGSALVGVVSTVLGQFLVARVFGQTTTLSVVVNLVGGTYFIWLLMRTVRL